MTEISLLPEYDRQNAWLEILPPLPSATRLEGAIEADHVVVGGGFEIVSSRTGSREPPFVTRSGPTSEPTQDRTWSVTVENGSITRTDWRIRAIAVCLAVPAP